MLINTIFIFKYWYHFKWLNWSSEARWVHYGQHSRHVSVMLHRWAIKSLIFSPVQHIERHDKTMPQQCSNSVTVIHSQLCYAMSVATMSEMLSYVFIVSHTYLLSCISLEIWCKCSCTVKRKLSLCIDIIQSLTWAHGKMLDKMCPQTP